jgi:hypothetical protein
MNLQRQRGLSLIWISVLFMLLGLVSMGFYTRYVTDIYRCRMSGRNGESRRT